jgi:hypothetical protein
MVFEPVARHGLRHPGAERDPGERSAGADRDDGGGAPATF